jgi:acyl dehydratase
MNVILNKDVKAGDRLPPWVSPPVERIQLVRYAGASGDFNRIHVDEEFARASGYPTVFAHGMLSMGLLGQYLARWAGAAAVRRLQVRFKAITWPGDTVTCHGEITAVRADGDAHRVELKVWSETAKGVTLEGTAEVEVRS